MQLLRSYLLTLGDSRRVSWHQDAVDPLSRDFSLGNRFKPLPVRRTLKTALRTIFKLIITCCFSYLSFEDSAYANPVALPSEPSYLQCEYTEIKVNLARTNRPSKLETELRKTKGTSPTPDCAIEKLEKYTAECEALYEADGIPDPKGYRYVDDCVAWKFGGVKMFAVGPDNIRINKIHDSFGPADPWTVNTQISDTTLFHQYCVANVNVNRWRKVSSESECDSKTETLSQWYGEMHGILYIKKNQDNTCSSVASPPADVKACYAGVYFWYTSPISLIWEEGVNIEENFTVVKFPLDLSSSKQWSIWKASKKAPLIVFDPEHKGVITSATQLFGDWTFGGRTVARLEHSTDSLQDTPVKPATAWTNGYEPLSTLDNNNDRVLTGEEIDSLALWFDENQNGLSETGEVKSMSEVGVTKLYFQPNREDKTTNSLYADIGYERIVDGKTIVGSSVDWRADTAESKSELLKRQLIAGTACQDVSSPKLPQSQSRWAKFPETELTNELKFTSSRPSIRAGRHNTSKNIYPEEAGISGIWKWKLDKANHHTETQEGYLGFRDNGNGEIEGHSYSAISINNTGVGFDNIIATSILKGKKTNHKGSRYELAFTVFSDKNSSINSNAVYDPLRQKIYGETVSKINMGSVTNEFTYSWVAERVKTNVTTQHIFE